MDTKQIEKVFDENHEGLQFLEKILAVAETEDLEEDLEDLQPQTIRTKPVLREPEISSFWQERQRKEKERKEKLEQQKSQAEIEIEAEIKRLENEKMIAKSKRVLEQKIKLTDPSAPKKPETAYMMWRNKRENGMWYRGDRKIAQATWKNLSAEEKRKYMIFAMEAQIEYEKQLSNYKRPSDEELARLPVNIRKLSLKRKF